MHRQIEIELIEHILFAECHLSGVLRPPQPNPGHKRRERAEHHTHNRLSQINS